MSRISSEPRKSLRGVVFGLLTVREFSHRNDAGRPYWKCVCACGNEKTVIGDSLRRKRRVDCGCEAKNKARQAAESRLAAILDDPAARRVCTRCGEAKPLADYTTYLDKRNGRQKLPSRCNPCAVASLRDLYRGMSESEAKAKRRANKLMKRYGLTEDAYSAMHNRQDGRCAICKRDYQWSKNSTDKRPLVVDHDHKTGVVRDLLCARCNIILGACGDDSGILSGCVSYLVANRDSAIEIIRYNQTESRH